SFSQGRVYDKPLLLFPPVTIWARAKKDGILGPVKMFNYPLDETAYPFLDPFTAAKLPPASFQEIPLHTGQEIEEFPTNAAHGSLLKPFVVDGVADEWSGTGRYMVRDSAGDVPSGLAATDIRWVQVAETDAAFMVAISLGATPVRAER